MILFLASIFALAMIWALVRSADAFESLGWHQRTVDARLAMYCGRNPCDLSLPTECATPRLQLAGAVR